MKLQLLITALNHHALPDDVTGAVNAMVDQANLSTKQGIKKARELQAMWRQIVEAVKKGTGLVPRKYHSQQWTVLGMAVFGMSIGVSFSLALNNFTFIGLGLPIGMANRYGCRYRYGQKGRLRKTTRRRITAPGNLAGV